MKKLLILVLALLTFAASAQVSVSDLRVNHLAEPMGVDPSVNPTLSWILSSPVKNTLQSAYEVTVTSKHLVAQCFFANSADIVSRSAALLGKEDDARYYADVAAKVREAYLNEYVTPNGLISSDTQTAYVLALHFNMLPESLRARAVDRLADNVARYNDHITTGFLGTPYICNVLKTLEVTVPVNTTAEYIFLQERI